MPDTLTKQLFLSLLPPGSLWVPEDEKDLDLLLDGMATNLETIRSFSNLVAFIRDPLKTSLIDDLEKELGLEFDSSLTDQERRDRALSAKTANKGDGTDTFLQTKLQESGFNLVVLSNEPAVDPAPLLDDNFNIYCAGDNAFCGHEDAFCGQQAGELVVNGIPEFESQFVIPASSDYWHLIFFIGESAVRNATTNAIESITAAQIPISRRNELVRLIVKYKPLHTWCGLIVDFI